TIIDDDNNGPPILKMDQAAIDFGGVVLGKTEIQVVRVSNIGKDELTFTPPVITNGESNGFTISTQPLMLTLAPGQSTTFRVGFKPDVTSATSLSGALTVVSNGGNSSICLRGWGIESAPSTLRLH